VVVDHRDVHPLAQLALDDEALRRLDVLEVDAAEGRLHRRDDLDQLVRIALVELDVEHVDAGELLEQDALAFHDWLARQRANVAQAEHGGAVADHCHQVGPRGELAGRVRVGHDRLAGIGHARRVGQGQVALGHHRLGRDHLDLPVRREAVVVEGGLLQVVHRIGGAFGLVGHLDCKACSGTAILALPSSARASASRSSAPSQRATTIVATALPTKLVSERHSLMKRSTPRISAMPASGTSGTTDRVAARVTKPAPVTAAAPLELSIATSSSTIWSPAVRWVSVAWAMNSAAKVM